MLIKTKSIAVSPKSRTSTSLENANRGPPTTPVKDFAAKKMCLGFSLRDLFYDGTTVRSAASQPPFTDQPGEQRMTTKMTKAAIAAGAFSSRRFL